ncbi:TrkH family potassium uptake protein [Plebeiibacterium sediminum]|uniref:TrkH family potassium uptake protein n=1 Tax=Plebeiibacterium sediminum TaxID=2992112 RepID=A0AAE3M8M1_9BACT|nr:TrkH family potassium uptake protein [Plebeiobacterium sediminum]MCW3788590.1 TrkH family potassium uptake protein [Plebeiobacterium sediminum]
MLNVRIVLLVLGLLLIVEAVFMLITAGVSAIYGEYDLPYFLWSALICISTGGILFGANMKVPRSIGKREGYVIVTMVWIVFSFFGLLPFWLSKAIPSFTDAFFETMSGFTTTGSSILEDIEALPHGILFWRSIIQWLGGMGIIVLSLAILPVLGVGGMQLFVAEVPGPVPDKLHPRIADTAKRLWGIYVVYTLVETILLWIGGMTFFDAICHSFTTMATGGYSTKQASVAYFDSAFIQYVIIIFMFVAGVNFTLSYSAFNGKFMRIIKDEEFKYYTGFVLVTTILVAVVLYVSGGDSSVEKSFRDALFQVVSLITTTGYATADYLVWVPTLAIVMFMLMFVGGSAGSTGGGIKVMRIVILLKNAYYELRRLIHPNAVIPVRYNSKAVSSTVVTNVLAFIVIYMLIVGISMIIMSIMGYNLDTSIGAVATCIGNIGPGLGEVGPAANFAHIPDFGKWFLSLLMLIGRLEIFTVVLLFSPYFWRN